MNTETQYFSLDVSQPGAIRPEMLAKKVADVRRRKCAELAAYCETQPRAFEALWFLQWISMQPGGIAGFIHKLLAFMEPRLGTESARNCGRRKYTRAECAQVWSELPHSVREAVRESAADEDEHDIRMAQRDINGDLLRNRLPGEEKYCELARLKEARRLNIEKEMFARNEPYFHQLCVNAAGGELENFFLQLCVGDSEKTGRWYCSDVLAEVIAFMDTHAAQMKSRLAMTVVAEKVFDALDYAHSERVMVRIAGDPRFGKTEAVETWAAMWPGRARVVQTPSSSCERDLIRAVAEAFGIHQTFGTRGETLKDKVEFTIRFSGLIFIFDEGSFLLPSAFSATTAPARLNWIRRAIVDRKLPCVIVCTPQSYDGAVARFVKKTNYSIEQFLGRETMLVDLPRELSHEDLLAVARVHFPEADEDLLGLIAAKAMQSESYLKAVENIATRARYNAKKRGAKKLTVKDVDTSIAEVMPNTLTAPAPTLRQRDRSHAARRLPPSGSKGAAALRQGRADKISSMPGRGVIPVDETEIEAAAG